MLRTPTLVIHQVVEYWTIGVRFYDVSKVFQYARGFNILEFFFVLGPQVRLLVYIHEAVNYVFSS